MPGQIVPRGLAARAAGRYAERMVSDADIREVLGDLALRRGAGASFCPSEAARALAEDWRPLMGRVRRVAGEMDLRATQGGAEVDILAATGPIRLARR